MDESLKKKALLHLPLLFSHHFSSWKSSHIEINAMPMPTKGCLMLGCDICRNVTFVQGNLLSFLSNFFVFSSLPLFLPLFVFFIYSPYSSFLIRFYALINVKRRDRSHSFITVTDCCNTRCVWLFAALRTTFLVGSNAKMPKLTEIRDDSGCEKTHTYN